MENISIAKTGRTPEIAFDFAANNYLIKGEAYPEDVSVFFDPLMSALNTHFASINKQNVIFRIELVYFNSSSAKMLLRLLTLLDDVAGRGNRVSIVWAYEEGDDNIKELGEEFAEDLRDAKFSLEEVPI